MIDTSQDVTVVFFAIPLVKRKAEIPAIAGGAARIGTHDHVTVRGKELGFEREAVTILTDRAAVDE